MFGCVPRHLDASGCVRMHPAGQFRKISENHTEKCFFFCIFSVVSEELCKNSIFGGVLEEPRKNRRHQKVPRNFLFQVCDIYLGLDTTLRAHLGIGYHPGMASASTIGRLLEAPLSICMKEGWGVCRRLRNNSKW